MNVVPMSPRLSRQLDVKFAEVLVEPWLRRSPRMGSPSCSATGPGCATSTVRTCGYDGWRSARAQREASALTPGGAGAGGRHGAACRGRPWPPRPGADGRDPEPAGQAAIGRRPLLPRGSSDGRGGRPGRVLDLNGIRSPPRCPQAIGQRPSARCLRHPGLRVSPSGPLMQLRVRHFVASRRLFLGRRLTGSLANRHASRA